MTKQKSYALEFKAKVARELVEGDDGVGVVASRHQPSASMLSGWRRQLFDNADVIFSQDQVMRENRKTAEAHREEVDSLNRMIGLPTAKRDYLQRSLGDQFDRRGL